MEEDRRHCHKGLSREQWRVAMNRAFLCSCSMAIGPRGAVDHCVSESMAESVGQFGYCGLAGIRDTVPGSDFVTLTLMALLRSYFTSTVHTHINTGYPWFSTEIAYFSKLVSLPTLCKHL